jgi:methylmalonyl-CoA mutase cobalamin-binding subunit
MILNQLCREAGAETFYLGAEKDPDQIVEKASEIEAEAILISTHNGMALDYATQLKAELEGRKLNIPVVMGGVLNQKVEGQALPADVTQNLKQLGFHPSAGLEHRLTKLLDFSSTS